MEKILVISATNDNNLALAKELNELLSKIGVSSEIVCLEDLKLPLYNLESIAKRGCSRKSGRKNESIGRIHFLCTRIQWWSSASTIECNHLDHSEIR